MYIYIYMIMYTNNYIYITLECIYIYIFMHTHIYRYTYTCIYIYIYLHIDIDIHLVFTQTSVNIHTYIDNDIYIYIHRHAPRQSICLMFDIYHRCKQPAFEVTRSRRFGSCHAGVGARNLLMVGFSETGYTPKWPVNNKDNACKNWYIIMFTSFACYFHTNPGYNSGIVALLGLQMVIDVSGKRCS